MSLFAVEPALSHTLTSLAIWLVLFPVLVQGLIIYAIVLVRGEKRANDEYKAAHRRPHGS